MVSRRDFARELVAAAAVASSTSIPKARTTTIVSRRSDDDDRSQDRDPMAIHRSTIVVNGLDPSSLSVDYLELMKQGVVGAWLRAEHQTLSDLAESYRFYDRNRDRIAPVRTVGELRVAHAAGKVAQIQGWQSAEQLSADARQGALIGPAINNLRAYYELGLRTCGIAYNLANEFGAGCLEPHLPLTRNGRKLVEMIHSLRMVLDVGGHTGEQTSLDALAMSGGVPVVCTHTNVKAIVDNPRCTSDRVFERIAATGGVIGLTAFSDFHVRRRQDTATGTMPQATLEQHLDQYDYLKKLVGVDHIGLGPDFTYGGTKPIPVASRAGAEAGGALPDRNANGSEQYASAEAYGHLPWRYVKGFETIAETPNVTAGLIRRGWSTAEIRKVLGENWLRVYQRVWGA